jgi:septation ring formation regulator EzrA
MKKVTDAAYNKNFGRTICEVHREINDIFEDSLKGHPNYSELSDKLQEAYTMAKKMDAKLRQYANNYDDGWWEQEKQSVIKEKLDKRKKR